MPGCACMSNDFGLMLAALGGQSAGFIVRMSMTMYVSTLYSRSASECLGFDVLNAPCAALSNLLCQTNGSMITTVYYE